MSSRMSMRLTHSEALFWANDMDDALPAIRHPKVGETKRLHVLLESRALRARVWLSDEV